MWLVTTKAAISQANKALETQFDLEFFGEKEPEDVWQMPYGSSHRY